MTGRELGSEGAVCCGESRNGGAITGCNFGEVGDSLDRVLMVYGGVGGLETGAGSDDLQLPPFLVGSCEDYFEGGPGLICRVLVAPNLAVVEEQASLKNELVGDGNNPLRSVRSLSCCRIFNIIFYLIRLIPDGMIDIVRSTKPGIVVLQVRRGDFIISGVKMV